MRDKSKRLTVINTSKRDSSDKPQSTTIPVKVGSGGVADMSDYLLKSVWAKAWDIRVDSSGNEYVFGKLPVLLQYGLTMYADADGVSVPSLFDGLPIDNNTLYWEDITDSEGNPTGDKRLKAKIETSEGGSATLLGDLTNVGSWANEVATEDRIMVQKKDSTSWTSLLISELGTASFENVKADESSEGNAFTSFTLSEDKKTLTFVKGETFATKKEHDELDTKVKDFLEGSNADGIINKWKELEGFLEGMSDSDELATILATKWTKDDVKIANWDTAFGWGNHADAGYAKKTYVDSTFVTIAGTEDVTGLHNFTNGIKIGGVKVSKSQSGVLYLEGDLVLKGGITMYGDTSVTQSTIMDSIVVDGTTIMNDGTKLYLNPNIDLGGGASSWDELTGKPSWIGSTKPEYTFAEIKTKPTTIAGYGITDAKIANGVITLGSNTITPLTQALGDARYLLQSGGIITGSNDYPLTINTTSGRLPYIAFQNGGVSGGYVGGLKSGGMFMQAGASGGTYSILKLETDGSAAISSSGTYYDVWTDKNCASKTAGNATHIALSEGTSDAYRPIVLTNMADTGQNLYYTSKITGNYSTGDLKVVSTTIDGVKLSKSQDGVLFLEGNLVVSGGVTMYGTNSTTASTVMDGVRVDDKTISKANGYLEVIGGVGGGGLDSVTVTGTGNAVTAASLSNNVLTLTKGDTFLTQTTGDARYVTALGTNGNYLTWTKNGTANNITVPYATTAGSLSSYKAITFTKADNGGNPCYLLISDVTSWYSATAGGEWGIVGVMYGWRGGNLSGTCVQKMIAMCAYSNSYYQLKTDVVTYVKPRIVSYNSKYYLALYMTGSGRSHYFIGKTSNLLSSFITLNCSSGGVYSGLTVLHDTDTLVMNGVSVSKLSTARTVSLTGNVTGSGSFDGSANLNIATTIPTRDVYINGTGWTVHSPITTDTTGIYAPTDGGTSGYVLKANGSTSVPTWVAQSSLSVGDSVKFSGVSMRHDYNFASGTMDANIMYTIDTTALSTSYFYPVVFHSTGKDLYVRMFSTQASSTYAYNQNKLEFTFRGQGWNDTPLGLTVHYYGCFDAAEKTIGCIGMGTEQGDKVVWVRGGLYYYMVSNITPSLKTSNYTSGNEIYTVGTNLYGGTNTKVTLYWTPQVTSGLGTLYHSSHFAAAGAVSVGTNFSVGGTSTFTGTVTAKDNVTVGNMFQIGSSGSYARMRLFGESSNTYATGGAVFLQAGNYAGTTTSGTLILSGINAGDLTLCKVCGPLHVTGKVSTDNSYFVKGTSGAGNGYSLYNESLPTQYGIFMGTTANFSTHGGVTGGWATYFCMNSFNEARGWIFRNSYNNTNVASISTSGNLLVTGGVTMYSDIRKKTKLKDVELTLDEVADAPLIEHYYNADEKKTTHVGSVAQYWAGLNDWFCKKDDEGFYTMEIQNAALASSISVARELRRYESATDKEIRELKEQIVVLENEIKYLKGE